MTTGDWTTGVISFTLSNNKRLITWFCSVVKHLSVFQRGSSAVAKHAGRDWWLSLSANSYRSLVFAFAATGDFTSVSLVIWYSDLTTGIVMPIVGNFSTSSKREATAAGWRIISNSRNTSQSISVRSLFSANRVADKEPLFWKILSSIYTMLFQRVAQSGCNWVGEYDGSDESFCCFSINLFVCVRK